MRLSLDRVGRRLAQHHATALPDQELTGGVLALFLQDENPRLLFTRRAPAVANFPGEVSFPGGTREPQDASLLATALRETDEEISVPATDIDIAGRLDDHHVYGQHQVRCFVGIANRGLDPKPNPAEVERIFTVALSDLVAAEAYEGRQVQGHQRTVHYFRVEDETIWGATGGFVADLLHIVADWQPPKPPRVLADWRKLQQDLA